MKKKLFSILFAMLAMFAVCIPAKVYSYAESQYTVNFYGTDDALLSSLTQTVEENGVVTKPEESASEGYLTLWYTSAERTTIYSFSTAVTTDVNLYARQVEAYSVNFMQRSASYTTGANSSEYELYTQQRIVPNSYAHNINGQPLVGYTFSHWSTTSNGAAAFDFYSTSISSNVTLYPVYNVQTFGVSFYSNGVLEERQDIAYNTIGVTPPTVSKEFCEFVGWKEYGDTSNTLVDLSTVVITEAKSYEAVYNSLVANVTISSSPYYTVQNTVGSTITRGQTLVIDLKLTANYSTHTLEESDLYITGTYDGILLTYDPSTDVYTVLIYKVDSDLTFNVSSIPLNKYTVTLPEVEGLTFNVTTISSDYTLSDGVYTLSVTKNFTFTVSVETGYYAKTLAFTGCTVSGGTYSLTNRSSIAIQSTSEIVKYYTLTFEGAENTTLGVVNNYLEKSGYEYKYEDGTRASFTITPATNYFVKSVTGASGVSGEYSVTLDGDKTVTLNVVYYYTLSTTPATGIENIVVAEYLEKISNDYKIETGKDFVVSYNIADAYSESNVTASCAGLTVTNQTNSFTISAVSSNGTIVFNGLQLNQYMATLVSNSMAAIKYSSQATAVYSHGETLVVDYQIGEGYSQRTLTIDNVIIAGAYENISIAHSTITITNISSDINVMISGLEINTYSVTNSANGYGTFVADKSTYNHGDDIVFEANLEYEYNRASLVQANVTITGTYDSVAFLNNIVTIYGAQSDITMALKDLPLNQYFVQVPAVVAGQFVLDKSSNYVVHGGSFQFTLAIQEAYTQNIDTFKLYQNGEEINASVINGNAFTYNVTNIIEDTEFTTSEFNINVYTVDFIDTSVTPNPTISVNILEHGQTISAVNGDKVGYEFDGWYTDDTFAELFDFDEPIKANTLIYAKYIIKQYDLVFVADSIVVDTITVLYGEDPDEIAPEIPEKVGYTNTPAYWDFASAGITTIVDRAGTINAIYTVNTYTVKFASAYKGVFNTQTVTHGSAAVEPTNTAVEGYTFVMWDNVFASITQDITINALYEINTYIITFVDANDGNKVVYTREVVYNGTVARPEDSSVTTVGKSVYGWYKDSSMTQSYDFNTSVKGDFTLYGDIDVTMLTLRFIANGEILHQVALAYNSAYTEEMPAIPEREGYDILGWSQTSVVGITTNLDIVANYKIKTFVVTFVYKDGTEDKVTVNYGTTITELPAKGQGFGIKLVADMNKLKNITSDVSVNVEIKDYNTLIFVSCGVLAAALVVLVIILSVRVKINGGILKENKEDKPEENKE